MANDNSFIAYPLLFNNPGSLRTYIHTYIHTYIETNSIIITFQIVLKILMSVYKITGIKAIPIMVCLNSPSIHIS